jgi:hypothetical protein
MAAQEVVEEIRPESLLVFVLPSGGCRIEQVPEVGPGDEDLDRCVPMCRAVTNFRRRAARMGISY